MTWNYRVMRYGVGDSECYGIHEVYYDKDGRPNGWTKRAAGICGDSIPDLLESIERVRVAFCKKVLDYETGCEIPTAISEETRKWADAQVPEIECMRRKGTDRFKTLDELRVQCGRPPLGDKDER